jgi:histidinol-phosphate phosphatase family protein
MSGGRRAAFLDRDGTLIEDAHYLADPSGVRLIPGVIEPVRRLNNAGVLVVIVTNQSGIARGFLTEEQYQATNARTVELLRERGARVDAAYHCPHHPDVTGPCDCRKPGTGLHRRAAADLGIDLTRSLYIGDRYRDLIPGEELGGICRLVPSHDTPERDLERARVHGQVATSLDEAVAWFLEHHA